MPRGGGMNSLLQLWLLFGPNSKKVEELEAKLLNNELKLSQVQLAFKKQLDDKNAEFQKVVDELKPLKINSLAELEKKGKYKFFFKILNIAFSKNLRQRKVKERYISTMRKPTQGSCYE